MSMMHELIRQASRMATEAASRRYLISANKVGARPRLHGAPFVQNAGRLNIGHDFCMSSQPSQSHLVTGPAGLIEIGDDVFIADGAAIAAQEHVRIGHGARLGAHVMIMDTDFHDASDPNAAAGSAPIDLGDNALIEDHVTILKGTRLGNGVRIGAGSVISGTFPPGSYVRGVPGRVVRGNATETADNDEQIGDRVRRVVGETFSSVRVELTDAPAVFSGWDSLGTLRLLVALEEEFKLTLAEAAMLRVSKIEDLVTMVSEAQYQAGEHAGA